MRSSTSVLQHRGSAGFVPRTAKLGFALAVVVLTLPPFAHWDMQARIVPGAGLDGDMFGYSLSISGDTFVAGAMWDNVGGFLEAGSAYVYTRTDNTWTEQAHLLASDGVSYDWYGKGVAVDGDRLVISAPKDDTVAGANAGSVHAYLRSGGTWNPDGHLYAGSAAANDWFGGGLAISGDTFVAGASFGDAPGVSDAGTAYIFKRGATNWTQQDQIFASDPGTTDNFGANVAISGETLVVSANWWDSATEDSVGAAYVFLRVGTSWIEVAKLLADDGAGDDEFGSSVAIDGDVMAIGSSLDDTAAGVDSGSVYVYTRVGGVWNQAAHLFAQDGPGGEAFGIEVAVSGDTILVGAQWDKVGQVQHAGAAYMFTRTGDTWVLQDRVVASDPDLADEFGETLALSGDTAVVAAMTNETAPGIDVGTAYVFVQGFFETYIGEPPTMIPARR